MPDSSIENLLRNSKLLCCVHREVSLEQLALRAPLFEELHGKLAEDSVLVPTSE